jgi:hypothetical protein
MALETKGHSAKVSITLLAGGRRVPVAQVGNSGLMVRSLDQPIPAGVATLIIRIDESKKRYRILLPHGLSETDRFTKFF